MRDLDPAPDDGEVDVRPDDPAELRLYARRLRARYPDETDSLDPEALDALVRDSLALCPGLRIKAQRDVLRFAALRLVVSPAQKESIFVGQVIRRVLGAVDDWSATKRLDFIYRHVVGRPAPAVEPDFGPW